jgi:hypothetical protein
MEDFSEATAATIAPNNPNIWIHFPRIFIPQKGKARRNCIRRAELYLVIYTEDDA